MLSIPGLTYPVRDLHLEDVLERTSFVIGRGSKCVCSFACFSPDLEYYTYKVYGTQKPKELSVTAAVTSQVGALVQTETCEQVAAPAVLVGCILDGVPAHDVCVAACGSLSSPIRMT